MQHIYSDKDEPAVQQAKAGWSAVHEARRAITVAWTGTIVNLLVVITALFVPYLQRHFDNLDKISERTEIKSFVLGLAREQLQAYIKSMSKETAGETENDRVASPEEVKMEPIALQYTREMVQQQRRYAGDDLFASTRSHAD